MAEKLTLTAKEFYNKRAFKHQLKRAIRYDTQYYEDVIIAIMEAYATERIENLTIPVVNNWVKVKDALPDNCDQVFVKYENGKYGVNEWWENDNCWKYEFDNMIVKEWCKTPCS